MFAVEALLRWTHPTRGLIQPTEFIGLAEETGQIFALGRWVLHEACGQMKRWQIDSAAMAGISVGVNISCRQFARRDTLNTVRQVLSETGLDPRYLRLEITETAVMADVACAKTEIVALREMGVQIDLDDFGTGYSSLGYLHQMPIEAVKIDRSFINAMDAGGHHTPIVQAIIALAHSLQMRVVAEGVETEAHLENLSRLGCDYAQGFLLSMPLMPTEVPAFAEGNHDHAIPLAA
jgi:EAL domain-containing protein (putative c-di-GMP-specific phosphodiesterase class I)